MTAYCQDPDPTGYEVYHEVDGDWRLVEPPEAHISDSCDQYDDYWYDSANDKAIASEEADNA